MSQPRGKGLSAAEAARLIEGYENGDLTRREYCRRLGIPVTTLDYYRRRQGQSEQGGRKRRLAAELVEVKLAEPARVGGFALVLSNGRRIESGWGFPEQDLARVVRVAEQA